MSIKVELKEKMQAIDTNVKELWDAMDEVQQKHLVGEFFILNRYISNVKSNDREIQEHFVLSVNEYYNKNWNNIQKHPKLLWMLLCMCNYDGKRLFYHEWIGNKKKVGSNTKRVNFLANLYPNKKMDDIELMAMLTSDKELKDISRSMGYSASEIKAQFK